MVGQRNLRGLRQRTTDRLGINPNIASLPLIQLIWLSIVAIFNWAHGKFSVKYASETMQECIVESVLRRINLPNLFTMKYNFEFPIKSYPRKGSREMAEWTPVALKDVRNWLAGQGFPLNPCPDDERTVEAMCDLELGAFSAKQVPHYSLLVRKMEIYLSKQEMTQAEYFEALKQKPSNVKILCRKMSEPPDEYDPHIWGPWPEGGMMVSKKGRAVIQKLGNPDFPLFFWNVQYK